MPILTILDTLGIQHYVFATNRLREAIGGSALVGRLGKWIEAACGPQFRILVAGGNALLRFDDEAQARSAMTRLSRVAHDEAPGLELAAVHVAHNPGGLADALRRAQAILQGAKLERSPTAPLLGLGVTASCAETRQPATALDVEGRPVAASVAARRRSDLTDRWSGFLPADHLRFPVELDQLGRSRDDRSLMGVVHIDGNGVGRRIADWLRSQAQSGSRDEDVIAGFRDLSAGLEKAAHDALAAVVARTVAAVSHEANSGYQVRSRRLGRGFTLSSVPAENVVYLPIRPVILGGDDLTFVCDGRLALDLAAAALAAFERATVPVLGRVHASAGVAISRTHAPVLRVYELAEELCKEAKQHVRATGQDASAIDWHIGFASPTESLAETRRRQYGSPGLTLRPYLLGSAAQAGTWRWLADVALGTGPDGLHGPMWSQRRSKVKGLLELARDGADAVARGIEAWRLSAPELKLPRGLPETGFIGDRTPLLDAVELFDIHLPLEDPAP